MKKIIGKDQIDEERDADSDPGGIDRYWPLVGIKYHFIDRECLSVYLTG